MPTKKNFTIQHYRSTECLINYILSLATLSFTVDIQSYLPQENYSYWSPKKTYTFFLIIKTTAGFTYNTRNGIIQSSRLTFT